MIITTIIEYNNAVNAASGNGDAREATAEDYMAF